MTPKRFYDLTGMKLSVIQYLKMIEAYADNPYDEEFFCQMFILKHNDGVPTQKYVDNAMSYAEAKYEHNRNNDCYHPSLAECCAMCLLAPALELWDYDKLPDLQLAGIAAEYCENPVSDLTMAMMRTFGLFEDSDQSECAQKAEVMIGEYYAAAY